MTFGMFFGVFIAAFFGCIAGMWLVGYYVSGGVRE